MREEAWICEYKYQVWVGLRERVINEHANLFVLCDGQKSRKTQRVKQGSGNSIHPHFRLDFWSNFISALTEKKSRSSVPFSRLPVPSEIQVSALFPISFFNSRAKKTKGGKCRKCSQKKGPTRTRRRKKTEQNPFERFVCFRLDPTLVQGPSFEPLNQTEMAKMAQAFDSPRKREGYRKWKHGRLVNLQCKIKYLRYEQDI